MSEISDLYSEMYEGYLRRVATKLESLVLDHLGSVPHVDRVSARAKDPKRFRAKAEAIADDGRPRYGEPLTEIQDQLGVRIIVFYLSDVDAVREVILAYFRPIEEQNLVPESDWEFGYFGQHLVLALPPDVVPPDVDSQLAPRFFELQIKTLFQHAWSEANHDLGYKTDTALGSGQKRRLAFTAAQAWGADRIFDELRAELTSTQ